MQQQINSTFYKLQTVMQLAEDERELFGEEYYNYYTYYDVPLAAAEVACVRRIKVYCAFYVAGEVQDVLLHAYMDADGELYIDGEQYEECCI